MITQEYFLEDFVNNIYMQLCVLMRELQRQACSVCVELSSLTAGCRFIFTKHTEVVLIVCSIKIHLKVSQNITLFFYISVLGHQASSLLD